MKRIHIILLSVLLILISSCSTTYTSMKRVMQVQEGMSQREVQGLLGTPDYRRFDGYLEEWEFYRENGNVLISAPMTILIQFVDGEVTRMNTYAGYGSTPVPSSVVVSPAVVPGIEPLGISPYEDRYSANVGRIDFRALPPADFDLFFREYRNEPFDSGRVRMLDNLTSSSNLTCRQCCDLIDLCTYDSEKKKLIKRLYPAIADKKNFQIVLDKLTFESDKREIRQSVK
ncbi:DUF4476 domain-containing protein [Bacteroides reticulotermitis]|nr:DUF4476 domain-containing protein [Bacteroides reticulotermitis]MBB4046056.1 hypothetical protein [Bacteroides reticulotermitis]HJD77265.1 DUF4476 domain-containing protein [Bacteroides reticulotermitis]